MRQADLVALQRVVVDKAPRHLRRADQPLVSSIPVGVHEAEALLGVLAERLTVASAKDSG